MGEMGCGKDPWPDHVRSWAQAKDFFAHFTSISGFAASALYGNKDFNMLSDKTTDAEVLQDGQNFFDNVASHDMDPHPVDNDFEVPTCPEFILPTDKTNPDK